MKTRTTEPKNSFKNHIWRRLLAIFIVLIMAGSAMLAWRIQIREIGMEYVGTVLEQASEVTEENTGYLSESLLERAWQVLTTAIFRPKTFDEFETYASLAIAKGEYAEAAEYLQSCIDLYSGDDDAALAMLWLRKGSLYTLCEDRESAVSCYDTALALDGSLADAYLLRAQMKSEQGETEAAAADLLRYEELAGDSPVIQAALGGLYESIGDYTSAIDCYTLAIDSGSYDTDNLVSRARCRILNGDSASAETDLERYFQEGGTDETGTLYAMLGMCRMESEEYSDAIKAFHSAIAWGYEDSATLYSQCVACAYISGDYETVIADGGQAVALAIENESEDAGIGELYQWIGFSHFILGEYADAAGAFENALSYDSTLPYINYYAGISLMSDEQTEEAIPFLTESAAREEYASICLYDSALCYIQLEEYDLAMSQLEAAIEAADDDEAVTEAESMLEELENYMEYLADA